MKSSITIMLILGMVMMMSFSTSKTKEKKEVILDQNDPANLVLGTEFQFTYPDGTVIVKALDQEMKDRMINLYQKQKMEGKSYSDKPCDYYACLGDYIWCCKILSFPYTNSCYPILPVAPGTCEP